MTQQDYGKRILEAIAIDGDKFIQKIILEAEARRDFFQTSEFNRIYEIVRGHERIGSEDLAYKVKEIPGLTVDQFEDFCSSVIDVSGNCLFGDPENSCSANYRDISVRLVTGQGTSYNTTPRKR